MKIFLVLALFALCPEPKEYILYDVVYRDYWCGDGYKYEKYKAIRFTYDQAKETRIKLWHKSEYCDPEPIVIEHVGQRKPTPNPWSETP